MRTGEDNRVIDGHGFLKDHLLEVEVISVLVEKFFVANFFGNHAASAFRAENIQLLSGKEHEPTHIAYIFVRQSHLFSSSFQCSQGSPCKECV